MNTTSNPKLKAAAMLSLGVLCASLLTAGIAGATEPAPATPTTPTTVTSSLVDESPDADSSSVEPGMLDADQDIFSDWEPTEHEIAEINAEVSKLTEALTAAGITFTLETDEYGLQYPEWDAADDDKAWEAIEKVFGDMFIEDIDFDDADFDDADWDDTDWDPTVEEIAEINELIKSEIEALTDAGISFTLETDEFGFEYPLWDVADEDAAWEALEALWDSQIELLDADPAGE